MECAFVETPSLFYRRYGFKEVVRTRCQCEERARQETAARNREEALCQLKLDRVRKLQARCGLGIRFAERTFESFNPPPEDQWVYQSALDYAEKFTPEIRTGLWFWSIPEGDITGTGNGKTHLAAAVMNRVLERGIPALFLSAGKYFDLARDVTNSESGRLLAEAARVPLLVLDDLGKEKPTEWALARLFNMLNERYEACRPVIVTSNLDPAAMVKHLGPSHGPALTDRLVETTDRLRLKAPSYRMPKLKG